MELKKKQKTPLTEEEIHIQRLAYDQYLKDIFSRLKWISILIAAGEACLMVMDVLVGFFDEHPLNILNFLAELLLIVSSAVIYIMFMKFKNAEYLHTEQYENITSIYRVAIIISVMVFIFTDIYVRQRALGTYLVFLFVLQVTPSYFSLINWFQFSLIGIFTLVNYIIFVPFSANTVFGVTFIFFCFAVSTDFFRRYFIKQLENYFRAERSTMSFMKLSEQTVIALSNAVEAKDMYTKGHSQRVAEYSEEISRRLGYSEKKIREVYFIGLMHDIGKIGVPDAVINKPGRLNDEEFAEIKKHPYKGYEILKQITELPGISQGARWHHERYDGKGYPDGLKGKNIPKIARIIAVADSYDAMTSNRSYRGVMPQEKVREQIETNAGTQFDPKIAEIMLQMIDEDTEYHMHE